MFADSSTTPLFLILMGEVYWESALETIAHDAAAEYPSGLIFERYLRLRMDFGAIVEKPKTRPPRRTMWVGAGDYARSA